MSDEQIKDDALTLWQRQCLTNRSAALVRRGLAEAKGLKALDKMQPPSERSGLQESDPWAALIAIMESLALGDVTNSLGMKLVRIPEGKFMMGSDAREDEKPVHEVIISRPFYMGRHTVTQSQWQKIMGSNPSKLLVRDDYPVHGVSWDDAQEFIRRLNLFDDQLRDESNLSLSVQYRLPSEAEWEYACRAGITGELDASNYFDRVDGNVVNVSLENHFGLFEMLAMFKEWCQDRYHVNYNGAPSDGKEWGEVAGKENRVPQMNRVARGAFFESPLRHWRAAARSWGAPSSRGIIFGLRIVAVER